MSTAASVQPFLVQDSSTAVDDQVRRENVAVARRLKRQDAGLPDELIARYQHRLLRSFLVASAGLVTALYVASRLYF